MTTETNAERLELVKDLLEWVEIYSTENSFDALKHTLEKLTDGDHIDWIIQQAEHAEKLCKLYNERGSSLSSRSFENLKLRKENARLQKALEKIAASGLDCFENECTYIARQALSGNHHD